MTGFRSIFSLIFAVIIAHHVPPLYADDAVPLLIWGDLTNPNSATSAVNPFLKTSRAELSNIVMQLVGTSTAPVLVFLKDNLCVEELTHNTELRFVTNSDLFIYLPAAQTPLTVFNDLPYNLTYDDNPDSVSNGELVIVPVTNIQGIYEKYKAVKDANPNLIAIFTGKSCSFNYSERVKRDISSTNTTKFIIRSDRVLFYSSKLPLLKVSKDKDPMPVSNVISYTTRGQGTTSDPLILTLKCGTTEEDKKEKYELQFHFEVQTAGYYTMKTVIYKEGNDSEISLKTNSDVVFPFNFSYHCSQNTVYHNNHSYLNITNLQVQVDTKSFGDAYDCVGFTTIPIWTGIFVTAILALIMIWGLTMIMDIRTMDRFDDPKGKTITISAQE